MTGPTPPEVEGTRDLGVREVGAVAPLMVALVLFGFFPGPLLDVANPAIESLMSHVGVTDDAPEVPPESVEPEPATEEGGH